MTHNDHFGVQNRHVYANSEKAADAGVTLRAQRGDSSDEVDPRKLVRDPTLSEIRWYYRRTFAKVLVDKPVDDAFKNGFEFTGDNAEEARDLLETPEFDEDDGVIDAYRLAEKKARRDGFALLFLGTEERGSAGIHESPISTDVDVQKVSHVDVLTIDSLQSTAPHEQIKEGTGLDSHEYRVRKTGIVVDKRPNSRQYRKPIGYVLGGTDPQFIHRDRIVHLTWNKQVDGPYDHGSVKRFDEHDYLGQYEGDSVLMPTYDILKGIAKGNWSVMQALFRNAAHMYTVNLPRDADEADMAAAIGETENINSKSAMVLPDGYEVNQHESGGELEPSDHYDVLFNQVCAGQEMTKSVLFGTQAGTVSGSETDIKNYFNKVERYRTNRAESKINEILTKSKRMVDSRTSDSYAFETEIDWGPLFKVDKETRISMLQTAVQAGSTAIGQYVMTPDEAREIIESTFAEIDLGNLTESQMDELDRIRLASSGQGPQALASEGEYTNAPSSEEVSSGKGKEAKREGGEEGGMEQGQQTASNNPASDDMATELVDHMIEDTDDRQGEYVVTPDGRGLVFDTVEDGVTVDGAEDSESDTAHVVALSEGGSVVWDEDENKILSRSAQSVTVDLPDERDRSDLLDWWRSVGADVADASAMLQEQQDINSEQADEIAASYKDMALGHDAWRSNGY